MAWQGLIKEIYCIFAEKISESNNFWQVWLDFEMFNYYEMFGEVIFLFIMKIFNPDTSELSTKLKTSWLETKVNNTKVFL